MKRITETLLLLSKNKLVYINERENIMTTNYNPMSYIRGSENFSKNEKNLLDFKNNGRCNNCAFFNFGKKCCIKTNEKGELIRPNITVEFKTEKGKFINFVRPSECTDYKSKSSHKVSQQDKKEISAT